MPLRFFADPRTRQALGAVAFGLVLAGSPAVRADPPDPLPPLTHPVDVYRVPPGLADQRRHFQFDTYVTYYDPQWNQFYGWDGTDTFYMTPPGGSRLGVKPGQWVRLSGEVTPSAGFRAESLQVAVLRPPEESMVIAGRGRLDDHDALNARLVDVEGLVDWQEQLDTYHLRLSLISEGHRLMTTVWLYEAGRAPLLAGAVVRARGLFLPRLDINRRMTGIEFKVQGVDGLTVIGRLATDPRFATPVLRIAEAARSARGTTVHVAGRVDSFVPGHRITLRDESGILDVHTPQELGLRLGAEIEVVGIRSADSADPQLEEAFWRQRGGAPLEKPAFTGVMTAASQVLALPAERAAAEQPVRLAGVVTWGVDGSRSFYLQDRTGGIRVTADPGVAFDGVSPGVSVVVTGVSAMGPFAPEVVFRQVKVGVSMSPPEPERISLEEAETGSHEGRWVEMQGYVRAVETAGPWTQLDLTTAAGEFQALLPSSVRVEDKVGAFVRIRGVCDSIANDLHRTVGIRLWVPAEEHIDEDEAPISNVFSIPYAPLESLGRFGSEAIPSRRVHTGGTVTYQKPGRYLVIQNGTAAIMVLCRSKEVHAPGDQVEVVGIPGWDGTRILLRESAVREVGRDPDLRPFELTQGVPVTNRFDCRLVQLKGLLTEVSDLGDEYLLSIQTGSTTVVARLDHARSPGLLETWRKGSTVEATGVYRLRFDENRIANGIDLLLRLDSDLVVLRSPPWWTTERALNAAGLLGICVLSVFLWVVSLRRRVKTQTEQLRRQMETQARMEVELERSQRLHSLGLLAGGIAHDFNNLLAVIMGNLTLAAMDEVAEARVGDCLRDAEEASRRAHRLTQQLLTFARGGDPVCAALSLPVLVSNSIALALSGSKSRPRFIPPSNLWSVLADEGQMSCAVQNLVAHASAEMPDGGLVEIEAANEAVTERSTRPLAPGRYVRLTVVDHGAGIPEGQLAALFDPYAAVKLGKNQFGLAAAYSILRKHRGLIEVRSEVGCGTTLSIWIPATDPAVVLEPGPEVQPVLR